MAAKKKKAGAAAAATGAGGANPAAAAAAGAPAKPAKPCGTCDPTLPYSIQFRVKDANGKLIEGMYYTVKYKNSGDIYEGTTQQHGRADTSGKTLTYYTSDAGEEVFLYIGHRVTADKYPESLATDEEKYDEAPLHRDTVAQTSQQKLSDANTERLWKPWAVSQAGQDWMKLEEGFERKPYNDHLGYATIGIGHLLHRSPVNAADRANYPNPLTDQEVTDLFDDDVLHRANSIDINDKIKVPLHQREFDALIDLAFQVGNQGAGAAITGPNASIMKFLNRGRYTSAGNFLLRFNRANSAVDPKVAARAQRNKDTFFNGAYVGP
jgi:GH24 family phage-related lysozyme (muramidase)